MVSTFKKYIIVMFKIATIKPFFKEFSENYHNYVFATVLYRL